MLVELVQGLNFAAEEGIVGVDHLVLFYIQLFV